MKYDIKCAKDILEYLEKNILYTKKLNASTYSTDGISIDNIAKSLKLYNTEDVHYTIAKLFEAKYIVITTIASNEHVISDITFEGHNYIDILRKS